MDSMTSSLHQQFTVSIKSKIHAARACSIGQIRVNSSWIWGQVGSAWDGSRLQVGLRVESAMLDKTVVRVICVGSTAGKCWPLAKLWPEGVPHPNVWSSLIVPFWNRPDEMNPTVCSNLILSNFKSGKYRKRTDLFHFEFQDRFSSLFLTFLSNHYPYFKSLFLFLSLFLSNH